MILIKPAAVVRSMNFPPKASYILNRCISFSNTVFSSKLIMVAVDFFLTPSVKRSLKLSLSRFTERKFRENDNLM